MKFKAIVFDTQNGKPMKITPRWISLNELGIPDRICGQTGSQYHEFNLWIKGQDDKMDNRYGDDPDGTYYDTKPTET